MTPEKCNVCSQNIWNPDFWGLAGMCGPCTTGEANDLFHELWTPPMFDEVSSEEMLLEHWRRWYAQVYLPANPSARDAAFKKGDLVEKKKGYSFPGTVVSVFENTRGEVRLVVEMDTYGLLHIFSPENLTHRSPKPVTEPLVGDDDPGG